MSGGEMSGIPPASGPVRPAGRTNRHPRRGAGGSPAREPAEESPPEDESSAAQERESRQGSAILDTEA